MWAGGEAAGTPPAAVVAAGGGRRRGGGITSRRISAAAVEGSARRRRRGRRRSRAGGGGGGGEHGDEGGGGGCGDTAGAGREVEVAGASTATRAAAEASWVRRRLEEEEALRAVGRCGAGHSISSENVCVTASSAVKCVSIFDRCCFGGAGGGKCENSDHAYHIKTWTLRMDSMTWVLDGMMDATELWGLDAYKCLPRVKVEYPVVSMDEHIICFMICDVEAWLIKVDMRSKMLLSVYSYPKAELKHVYPGKLLLPSKVSYYLNSYPGGGSHTDIIEPQSVAVLDKQLTCDGRVHASEIVAALQEISSYKLEGDDMQRAISILSHGNGHRFKSYLGIPMNLRKHWLLMEINAFSKRDYPPPPEGGGPRVTEFTAWGSRNRKDLDIVSPTPNLTPDL
ncbi:hypothetical protein EJB05_52204, partial [Eragrostis curvula]